MTMVEAASTALKIIFGAHWILTIWASMTSDFLPTSYIYMHAVILGVGLWAIISADSPDAIFMFMILNGVSILMDIIFLGIFTPVAHDVFEASGKKPLTLRHTYRFSLGMAIVNLIIKPFTCFVMYRIYQDRGGQYGGDLGIPGIPGFGGQSGHTSGYEHIDQPVPSNNVEAASPHSTIENQGRR